MRTPFALTALLLVGGCYTFNPSNIPSHIRTLEVPVADNQTLEVALSDQLTTAMTERFVEDNTLRVVQKDADALLECVITGYENRVFGFNQDQVANEYVVILAVDMTLRDRVKGKEIWSGEGVRGQATYALDVATDQGVTTEDEARALAIKHIVDFAISKTVEGW